MDKDNLERLKERLYRKEEDFSDRPRRRRFFSRNRNEEIPPAEWENPLSSEDVAEKIFERSRPKNSPMKKIFISGAIIFLLALGSAAYFWFGGMNFISSGNIDISVQGQDRADAGEQIPLEIVVENKNQSALETANLIIDFPKGAVSSQGDLLGRERIFLGKIEGKSVVKKQISPMFFGKEKEDKEILVTLEYRLENSNAIFSKESSYAIKMSKPAVGISIALPAEASVRQEVKIDAEIVSNSEVVIKNLVLRADYPSGFQFSKAEPEPKNKESEWQMGDFLSGQKRDVSVYGFFEGQDMEEKAVRFSAGVINNDGEFIPLGEASEIIAIKRPDIDLTIFLNGQNVKENIFSKGQAVRGEIFWKNNMPAPIRNAVLELKIAGVALDERSVSVSDGSFRSSDKTLIWNSSSFSALSLIDSGAGASGKFSFSIKDPLPVQTANDGNFTITLEAKISGRISSDVLGETGISSPASKQIKIASPLQMANYALHYSGSIKNSGPMPPKVGKETTYTVVWSLGNTSNAFSGAKVTANLPSYMRWAGNIYPAGENISFDEETGAVVWNAGNLSSGLGIIQPAKEVAFQISLMPNSAQAGDSPKILSSIILEAKDDFTGNMINENKQDLTTILTNDPQYNFKEGRVEE